MVPLPRLPINTGESTETWRTIFFEKERNKPGGKFWRGRGRPKQKERSINWGQKIFFGEKERRVDEQRGEDKKREEKFWKQREEATIEKRRGRATTTGYRDTNATRSTNTAALPTP
jgi:hypothetical protein